MRTRIFYLIAALIVSTGGLVTLSLGWAQSGPAQTTPPATSSVPPPAPRLAPQVHHDLSKFTRAQREQYVGAKSGVVWLHRVNGTPERGSPMNYVSTPSLWLKSQPEPPLRQAAAAVVLARAARYFGDERSAEIATQIILRLLLDTAPDDQKNPQFLTPTGSSANRLAFAGLLICAISELPQPQADILDPAELLCRYLYRQQRPNGSLTSADNPAAATAVLEEDSSAAEALHGLLRSCQQRPAPWKLDMVRKAFAFYHPRWQAKKTLANVPRFSAVYAEAFALTKDRAFADAVLEMNDWLCQFQYQQRNPLRQGWNGGFMSQAEGKAIPTLPDISSARYAESLANACRVARQAGDALRHPRYLEALEHCLAFVSTLQFTEGNTKHFHNNYRNEIKGAFFLSREDGNLRLDYTQQAVCAMLQYLTVEGMRDEG